jgi:hypothetical protein
VQSFPKTIGGFMTAREWFEKNKKRLSSIGRKEALCECAGATLRSRQTICEAYNKVFGKNVCESIPSIDAGVNIKDFRAKFDVLYKIRKQVKDMPRDRLYAESEFRQIVNADSARFRNKADLPEFDKNKGRAGGTTYWGSESIINQFKSEGVLQ